MICLVNPLTWRRCGSGTPRSCSERHSSCWQPSMPSKGAPSRRASRSASRSRPSNGPRSRCCRWRPRRAPERCSSARSRARSCAVLTLPVVIGDVGRLLGANRRPGGRRARPSLQRGLAACADRGPRDRRRRRDAVVTVRVIPTVARAPRSTPAIVLLAIPFTAAALLVRQAAPASRTCSRCWRCCSCSAACSTRSTTPTTTCRSCCRSPLGRRFSAPRAGARAARIGGGLFVDLQGDMFHTLDAAQRRLPDRHGAVRGSRSSRRSSPGRATRPRPGRELRPAAAAGG